MQSVHAAIVEIDDDFEIDCVRYQRFVPFDSFVRASFIGSMSARALATFHAPDLRPSARRRRTAAPPRSSQAPWIDDVERDFPSLSNVRFVLVNPQGPANVGAAARVMQNFGVYDLKLVDVGPFVLERPQHSLESAPRMTLDEASEGEGATPERASDVFGAAAALAPLASESVRYACAADWLLLDAERCATSAEALKDCTFVLATTARPRSGTPLLTAREAALRVAEEAKRGKVAVLFGNERTGLTNEDLAWAHAAVAIPTAGAGKICRRSLKYTGGTGPTSLNLSHAVGILGYEIYMAISGDEARGAIAPEKDKLLSVDEKEMLRDEIVRARRALDVLSTDAAASGTEGDDDDDDDEMFSREARSFERILAAAPMHRSDAAALFQLSRRVSALAKADVSAYERGERLLDKTIVNSLRTLAEINGDSGGKTAMTVKAARVHLRSTLGVSLTNREIERAIARATL